MRRIFHYIILSLGAALMYLVFFRTAPWLAAEPIENLPDDVIPPEWARTYHINHGEYGFMEHGTIAEQPLYFALHVLGLLSILSYLVYRSWKHRKSAT